MNSWVEKEGTLISAFGRVGKLRKAIDSGIIDNWKLIQQIGKKFGVKKKYSDLEEITSCLRKELNLRRSKFS
jgi:predicted molibdopterin-dependent oxidoreductase YjgC